MSRDEEFLSQLLRGAEYLAHRRLLTALFRAGARKHGARATHRFGVGGRGTLRVRDSLALPAHEVWQPGRRFDLVLRHANLGNEDDLSADYRGAALKLTDGGAHVVDLLMNTGETTVWCHVAMFSERMRLFLRGELPEFYRRHPDALERYWGGLRRAPDGYATLAYYSKLSGVYLARDGTRHACRYRLVPRDYAGTDTGLPSARDFEAGVLATERWPEETRPRDALRRAFAAELAAGSIAYRLDVAVRPAVDDFRDPMYDPCRAWDSDAHPWVALADLELDAEVPAAALEPLRFSIAHAPDSLGVFPAHAADDYTSIGHLRASLYAKASRSRPG